MENSARKHSQTLPGDITTPFSAFRTHKTLAFTYGFTFTIVVCTVFLVLNPSAYSSSWFTNIFNNSALISSPHRSHFPSIFSLFFPNPTQHPRTKFSPFSPQPSSTTFHFPGKFEGLNNSNSSTFQFSGTNEGPSTINISTVQFAGKMEEYSASENVTIQFNGNSEGPNKNNNCALPLKGSNGRINSSRANECVVSNSSAATVVDGVIDGAESMALRSKESSSSGNSSNETNGLMNDCNIFEGRWVKDDSYPLYAAGSCPHIDEPFNCFLNNRPDNEYQKFKWQPNACNVPKMNGSRMLELLRGKRLVFVGDSLNRNMWESLVCILRNSVEDKTKVFEASGRQEFRTEGSYSFLFTDYNCSVEFFRSPFLVQEWEMPDMNGSKKETLRLDVIERSSDRYKSADIIVFNTGHWWTHEKTSRGKGYYQEGSHIYGELNVKEAFRKALTTWARWIDANINPMKTMIFFRGYSSSHFRGGRWNSGGQCDSEIDPIKNEKYLKKYPSKMRALEAVMKGMKTPIFYLNITRMTDYRKDAHPSIYRKQNLTEEERLSPLRFQDCSHWCLPGVPDTWNVLLYAQLLVNHSQKQHEVQHQQQQQKRP